MDTLGEVFLDYVRSDPDRVAATVADANGEPIDCTRGALLRRAQGFREALTARRIEPGSPVVLAVRTTIGFLQCFWGAQLAGACVAPVPALGDHARRRAAAIESIERICDLVRPPLIVSDDAELLSDKRLRDIDVVSPYAAELAAASLGATAAGSPGLAAVIQFTSGSTSAPKGCVLSNRAVAANARALVSACDVRPGDGGVAWLPLHHDMGLMSGVVTPVFGGASTTLLSSSRFMANPLSWLAALAKQSRGHTAVPNFALAVTLQRLRRLKTPLDIDLSGVVSLMCGAEPIDADLVREFLGTLAPCGLAPAAFQAAYGMSETTVLACSRPGGLAVDIRRAAAPARSRMSPGQLQHDQEIVSVGSPPAGGAFRIVTPVGVAAADGVIGEIQLSSPSLMDGYFGDPDATRRVLVDGWLSTGDAGYAMDGELFVTGRIADTIIVGGRNITPHDIERAVSRAAGIAETRITAVGLRNDIGTQSIHVVLEDRADHEAALRLTPQVSKACFDACGVAPARVIFVPPGTIPRTTSGKKQRARVGDSIGDFRVETEASVEA